MEGAPLHDLKQPSHFRVVCEVKWLAQGYTKNWWVDLMYKSRLAASYSPSVSIKPTFHFASGRPQSLERGSMILKKEDFMGSQEKVFIKKPSCIRHNSRISTPFVLFCFHKQPLKQGFMILYFLSYLKMKAWHILIEDS